MTHVRTCHPWWMTTADTRTRGILTSGEDATSPLVGSPSRPLSGGLSRMRFEVLPEKAFGDAREKVLVRRGDDAAERIKVVVGSGDLGLADTRVDVRRIPSASDPSVIDLDRRVTVQGREYHLSYIELGSPGIPHAVVPLSKL